MLNVATLRKLRDVDFLLREVKHQYKTGTKSEFKEAVKMLKEHVSTLDEFTDEENDK